MTGCLCAVSYAAIARRVDFIHATAVQQFQAMCFCDLEHPNLQSAPEGHRPKVQDPPATLVNSQTSRCPLPIPPKKRPADLHTLSLFSICTQFLCWVGTAASTTMLHRAGPSSCRSSSSFRLPQDNTEPRKLIHGFVPHEYDPLIYTLLGDQQKHHQTPEQKRRIPPVKPALFWFMKSSAASLGFPENFGHPTWDPSCEVKPGAGSFL